MKYFQWIIKELLDSNFSSIQEWFIIIENYFDGLRTYQCTNPIRNQGSEPGLTRDHASLNIPQQTKRCTQKQQQQVSIHFWHLDFLLNSLMDLSLWSSKTPRTHTTQHSSRGSEHTKNENLTAGSSTISLLLSTKDDYAKDGKTT